MNLGRQLEVVLQRTLLLRRQTTQANGNQGIAHEPVGFDVIVTYRALAKVSRVEALNGFVDLGDQFRHLPTGLLLEKTFEAFQTSFQLLARRLQIRGFHGGHLVTYVLSYDF